VFANLLKGSLKSRFTRLIGIPASIFLVLAFGLVTYLTFGRSVESTAAEALGMARIHAAKLDQVLATAAQVPHMHARLFESGAMKDQATVKKYITESLAKTPGIYGSCLAFEPNTFIPGVSNYCPYAYWKEGQATYKDLVPPEYNHFEWPWYNDPKRLGHAVWTEPYFDEGGGNVIMTTRSVPFRKPTQDGSEGEFWGVATIDISLEALLGDLNALTVADTGYALLLSPEGRILGCPDKSKIMNTKLERLNPELAAALMPGSEGFIAATDPLQKRPVRVAYSPVPAANFMLALVYPEREVFADANRLLNYLIIIGVIGLLFLFTVLWLVARSVSEPVAELASAARKIADGDLVQRLESRSNIDEVKELSSAFEKMTRDLRMRMEELRYTTTLKERMAGELNAARSIQMSMLPREWRDKSNWQGHAHVALHAIIQPAREVGGDFYDYRFLDERRLSILIGDVSGKGVPAALFMAMTQTLFQAHADATRTVTDVMARVNNALCAETHTGMFVTLLYAMLDVQSGTLEMCNAGHLAPYRLVHGKPPAPIESARNPALGLVKDIQFKTATTQLNPADRVFFYTDGVTEAFNQKNELYSAARLEALLEKSMDVSVEMLTQTVIADVQHHASGHEASDDLTVLAVNFNPKEVQRG
jgi:sigma-B regulation protein RsbU (phosphoserine phosphatase)